MEEKLELQCYCGEIRAHEDKPFVRCKKCKRWLVRNNYVFRGTMLYINGETLYQRDMKKNFKNIRKENGMWRMEDKVCKVCNEEKILTPKEKKTSVCFKCRFYELDDDYEYTPSDMMYMKMTLPNIY